MSVIKTQPSKMSSNNIFNSPKTFQSYFNKAGDGLREKWIWTIKQPSSWNNGELPSKSVFDEWAKKLIWEMYDPKYSLQVRLNGNGTCNEENKKVYAKLFRKQMRGEISNLSFMKCIFDRSERGDGKKFLRHYLCVYMWDNMLWIEDRSNGQHKRMPYKMWADGQQNSLVQKFRLDIVDGNTITFVEVPDLAEANGQ